MAEETTIDLMHADAESGLDVVLRGYDRRQVDELVSTYDERLAHLESALDVAERQVHELETENATLAGELRAARDKLGRGGVPSYAELGERVAEILRLAEEEAAALRSTAAEEAGRLRASAAADAERWHAEAEESLAAERAAVAEERAAAESELAAGRETAQQEWQTLRQEGVEHAEWLVTQAREQADELLGRARADVEALGRQREEIHADLARLREVLAAATGTPPETPSGSPKSQ